MLADATMVAEPQLSALVVESSSVGPLLVTATSLYDVHPATPSITVWMVYLKFALPG